MKFNALIPLFVTIIILGCSKEATPPPREIGGGTECSMDGMLLAEYAGPKAQLNIRGEERTRFFCEIKELFKVYIEPGRKAEITAMYVQNTSDIDWKKPSGHWMPAKESVYVVDSRLEGAMGPTYAPFKTKEAASAFINQNGGAIMTFEEVVEKVQKEVTK